MNKLTHSEIYKMDGKFIYNIKLFIVSLLTITNRGNIDIRLKWNRWIQKIYHIKTNNNALKGSEYEWLLKLYPSEKKKFKKSKFWFVNNDGSKKEPKNNDTYFRMEWRKKRKFPFITRRLITYELINNIWMEY